MFAQNRNLSIRKMAKKLGIDRKTLTKAMEAARVSKKFSDITDEQLDRLVQKFVSMRPDSGFKYAQGFIRSKGHRVQETRLKDSLARVRPLATVLRQAQAIHRRDYHVVRPNALWHIDGHHKLIQYGIVIHGGVDGYTRYVSDVAFYYFTGNEMFIVCIDCMHESRHFEQCTYCVQAFP
jgi:hypothetical protein